MGQGEPGRALVVEVRQGPLAQARGAVGVLGHDSRPANGADANGPPPSGRGLGAGGSSPGRCTAPKAVAEPKTPALPSWSTPAGSASRYASRPGFVPLRQFLPSVRVYIRGMERSQNRALDCRWRHCRRRAIHNSPASKPREHATGAPRGSYRRTERDRDNLRVRQDDRIKPDEHPMLGNARCAKVAGVTGNRRTKTGTCLRVNPPSFSVHLAVILLAEGSYVLSQVLERRFV